MELIQADAVGGLLRGPTPALSPGDALVLESADTRLEGVVLRARMVRRATVTRKPMVVLAWERIELDGDPRVMGQALGRLLGLGKAAPLSAERGGTCSAPRRTRRAACWGVGRAARRRPRSAWEARAGPPRLRRAGDG